MPNKRTRHVIKSTHFYPEQAYWDSRLVIKIWEAAFLMHLVEPRLASDLLVQDLESPDDPLGVPLNISEFSEMIIGAIKTQNLASVGSETIDPSNIEITVQSFKRWLKEENHPAKNIFSYPDTRQKKIPLQRMRAQENEILETIHRLGYKPLELKKYYKGTSGAKRDVRDALSYNRLFEGNKIFDKAWERLRCEGVIRYAGEKQEG